MSNTDTWTVEQAKRIHTRVFLMLFLADVPRIIRYLNRPLFTPGVWEGKPVYLGHCFDRTFAIVVDENMKMLGTASELGIQDENAATVKGK